MRFATFIPTPAPTPEIILSFKICPVVGCAGATVGYVGRNGAGVAATGRGLDCREDEFERGIRIFYTKEGSIFRITLFV